MLWRVDEGLHFFNSAHAGIEVVDFEPEQEPVAVRGVVGICDGAVMVTHFESVQLKNQPAIVRDETFVFPASMVASAPKKALIPATAFLDIGHGNQRLRSHRNKCMTECGTLE